MSDDAVAVLSAVLGDGTPLRMVRRRTHPFSSSASSEILTFRGPHGTHRSVLLKTSAAESDRGSAESIAYEARVYRDFLAHLPPLELPRFIAAAAGPATVWLALEYVARAQQLRHHALRTYARAAAWLGRFHRLSAALDGAALAALHRESAAELSAPVERLRSLPPERLGPELRDAIELFEREAEPSLGTEQAPTHGEFYPANVLVAGARICAVDWERAALATPERDLATLLEGWDDADRATLERAYAEARWERAELPAAARKRLELARLQVALVAIGDELAADPRAAIPEHYASIAHDATARLRTQQTA